MTKFSVAKERKICGICSMTLGPKDNCQNQECTTILTLDENVNNGETYLVEMDFKKELIDIIEKNWSEITKYKEILAQKTSLDLCNTESYLSKKFSMLSWY